MTIQEYNAKFCTPNKRPRDTLPRNSEWELIDCTILKKRRLDQIKEDNLRPQSTKGLFICKHCKGDNFTVWQEQRRGGDEGMTTIAQCDKCPPEIGRFKV